MKYFLILLTVLFFTRNSRAQTAEDSVKAVISKMFTAMKNADGAMLQSCFSDSIIFQTIGRNKEGQLIVRTEKAAGFVNQVSQATPGSYDERISFDVVRIDGPLAIAWTPYHFYLNGKFNHCGVNSFQLIRFNGEWKIQYLVDTRRRQGCGE